MGEVMDSEEPVATGRATSDLDALRDRMGHEPDQVLAELAGVSPATVGRYRRRHGIPAYKGHRFGERETPVRRGRRQSVLERYRSLVGVLEDRDVARLVDVSAEAVRVYRRRHGIGRDRDGGSLRELGGQPYDVLVIQDGEVRRVGLRAPDMPAACLLATLICERELDGAQLIGVHAVG